MTKSILIIDNETGIREALHEILELGGYEVRSAINGLAGIKEALLKMPDLVLCDIEMPELNGWQTIKKFREIPESINIPFIFLTALPLAANFQQGMDSGADGFLTKPFKVKELLAVITRLLSKRKRGKQNTKKVIKKNVSLKIEKKIVSKDFNESLERAKLIQKSTLPDELKINQSLDDYFIHHLPKQTVSGDFFWVKNINDMKLIALADCTGHGVPAALLSMACLNMLNMAFKMYDFRSPAEALRKVNELIIEFLGSNKHHNYGDGMDISLCAIDCKNSQVIFAGAKRPVYLITDKWSPVHGSQNRIKHKSNSFGQKLIDIKGSPYSLGTLDFRIEDNVFNYNPGDKIYLFSDGYIDQFGGERFKKLSSGNLKTLLLSIQNLSIQEQGEKVIAYFEAWKKDHEQTDDVTILGISL